MSILIFQCVCFTAQAENLFHKQERFWGTFGGGGDFTVAFPYGTAEDVPVDDFVTGVRGIPLKARLGIILGNESPSFIFLSAQKTFFIDPIEHVPDFGTGLGMIFLHQDIFYHLVEIGVRPTRGKGTLLEIVAGEGILLGPLMSELTLHLALGDREDSPSTITFALTMHFAFPIM